MPDPDSPDRAGGTPDGLARAAADGRYRLAYRTSSGVLGHGTTYPEIGPVRAWIANFRERHPEMEHWAEFNAAAPGEAARWERVEG